MKGTIYQVKEEKQGTTVLEIQCDYIDSCYETGRQEPARSG